LPYLSPPSIYKDAKTAEIIAKYFKKFSKEQVSNKKGGRGGIEIFGRYAILLIEERKA